MSAGECEGHDCGFLAAGLDVDMEVEFKCKSIINNEKGLGLIMHIESYLHYPNALFVK